MQKLTLVLAIAALGLFGWQTWEAKGLRDDLAQQQTEQEELMAEVARLSKGLSAVEGYQAPGDPVVFEAALGEPSATGGSGEPSLAAKAANPEVLAREVMKLKNEMGALRAENEELKEKVGNPRQISWKRPTFIRDMDGAEKALDLSAGQRADMERVVDWTKRELEDLWAIPNEEGKLLKDIQKTKVTAGEGISIAMPNFQELNKFRNSKVPGRTETYAEAERRIKDRGKNDIKDILNTEQQETWDKAHTDPLFGSSAGDGVFSMVTVETSTSSESDD